MDNLTLNYVARIVPPERMQLYHDCHELLLSYYPDGWPEILDLIGVNIGEKTINDVEYDLHNAIIENIKQMVQECGVYLSDRYDYQHNLRQLYHCAHGLFAIENYPNIVALRTLFDAYTNTHDKFAAVLGEVEPGFDQDNFYSMAAEISPNALLRLDHALATNLGTIEPYLETHALVPVVQQLISEYAKEYPEIAEIPYQNITGTMDAYVANLRGHIVKATPPVAARLLMLCAVLAGLSEQEGRAGIGAAIEHLYREQLRVGITVSRLCLQLPYPEALNDAA